MARPYAAAAATALALLFADASGAQTYRDAGGSVVPGVVPLGGDGSGPLFTAGNPGKVSGSFSASLSGFQPTPSYSYQSVSTSSASYPLPTGSAVVVYNTGSNPITVKLGTSGLSVTAGQADVVPAGGWMAFAVGTATTYAVVGNGGASTVVVSGGSGLPTGAGGGGGGGGGTVAQGSAASASGAWPVYATLGGSTVSTSNPVPIAFGSGATLPAFAAPPLISLGLGGSALSASNPAPQAPVVAGAVVSTSNPLPIVFGSGAALPAGTNAIGSVSLGPVASGGLTHPASLITGLVGTVQYLKASAGQLFRLQCDNIAGTSPAYVQIFDAASGAALGTSVVDYVPIPAGGTGGFTLSGIGMQFTNGIGIAAATTPAGSTAAAASTVNCGYAVK